MDYEGNYNFYINTSQQHLKSLNNIIKNTHYEAVSVLYFHFAGACRFSG